MNPLKVRESKIPTNNPLIMVPTTFPRCSGALKEAAKGKISCGTIDVIPISKEAICKTKKLLAVAAIIKAITEAKVVIKICFFRSSSIAQRNHKKQTYRITRLSKIGIVPALASGILNSLAIKTIKG